MRRGIRRLCGITTIDDLLRRNEAWAASHIARDGEFFVRQSTGQQPRFFWIGCSDSRVPPTDIVGLGPGDMFVHRNVANVSTHADLSFLACLQFAVDVLGVREVIVCGHHNCGGVIAALTDRRFGLVDGWVLKVRDALHYHRNVIDTIGVDEEEQRRERERFVDPPASRVNAACEINAVVQAAAVCRTFTVRDKWKAGVALHVHGWIYEVGRGRVRPLMTVGKYDELGSAVANAMKGIAERYQNPIAPPPATHHRCC